MEGDDEFEAHPERLRQLREVRTIGRGSTGDAILVESLETRRLYCVKQIALAAPPPASEFGSEVDVLRRLEHENVTRFYGAYLDERDGGTRLRIVMEYADSGTLAQWLSLRWDCAREDERWGLIAEEEIMGCFAQVVAGLAHVHAQRVLHRDLKAENILVSRASERDETFKLSDFGISRILTETQAMATTCIGTPYYLSPEMVEGQPYSYKSDVWALGVLLYKMATAKPPFQGTNLALVANNIRRAEYKALPPRYSADFHYLVAKLLQIEPEHRPSASELVAMPFVAAALSAVRTRRRLYELPEALPPSRIPVLSRKPSTPGTPSGESGRGARWLAQPATGRRPSAASAEPLSTSPARAEHTAVRESGCSSRSPSPSPPTSASRPRPRTPLERGAEAAGGEPSMLHASLDESRRNVRSPGAPSPGASASGRARAMRYPPFAREVVTAVASPSLRHKSPAHSATAAKLPRRPSGRLAARALSASEVVGRPWHGGEAAAGARPTSGALSERALSRPVGATLLVDGSVRVEMRERARSERRATVDGALRPQPPRQPEALDEAGMHAMRAASRTPASGSASPRGVSTEASASAMASAADAILSPERAPRPAMPRLDALNLNRADGEHAFGAAGAGAALDSPSGGVYAPGSFDASNVSSRLSPFAERNSCASLFERVPRPTGPTRRPSGPSASPSAPTPPFQSV